MNCLQRLFWLAGVVAAGLSQAQPLSTQSVTFAVNQTIPDNNASGLASTTNLTFDIISLSNLSVTLNISNVAWNGDYYGYVVHDSGFAVLLNRVGRRAGDSYGYSDAGFNVTFDDAAVNGDIHVYRFTLFGNHTTALGGALTGIWAPDGRETDPDFVVDTDSRTALLSSFTGVNPNGEWTLFLADLSAGNEGVLVSWGLEAIGVVPEPGPWLLLLAGLPGMWWLARRRHG